MSKIRCAIYTRKSSEEGLEQDFNSLHAQREACSAYILSQASEGWSLLPGEYDDGGLSGGTLERPALKRLLADIDAGRIDIVVVYKVDRLTRSLLDFSKLVEAMDRASTSFVSVTQSFNTTTSMGRLTLNMLLSFAQFEREVTAERIRDKIAASKARGMWMGGTPPLGYAPDGRTLKIVPEHARLIQDIFRRYIAIGNVRLVAHDLDGERIRVPKRTALTGKTMGGGKFTRGQIYKILSNPMYLGEIHHNGKVYEGLHDAIIVRELWDQVQAGLSDNSQGVQRAPTIRSPSLLAGKVFDEAGEPLVATHACKGKVRYRYYVSRALQHQPESNANGWRIPARELEGAVISRLAQALEDSLGLIGNNLRDGPAFGAMLASASKLIEKVRGKDSFAIRALVRQVDIHSGELQITLDPQELAKALGLNDPTAELPAMVLTSAVRLTRTGMAMRLIHPGGSGTVPKDADRPMVELLVKARQWWARLSEGELTITDLAREEGINSSWLSRVVRLNFLAPELANDILAGSQPAVMNAARLTSSGPFPIIWNQQVEHFASP